MALAQVPDVHLEALVSRTATSLCTYAAEPPCTGRYARWCERSALGLESLLFDCSNRAYPKKLTESIRKRYAGVI